MTRSRPSGAPLAVLHVAQPTTAGVPRVVADLVADQVRRGWTVTVACPDGGRLADDVVAAGARRVRWTATRSPGPSVLGEARRLAALVEACSPDVVHLHSSKAGLAGRLALRGRVPTVFQPHGWSFLAADSAASRLAAPWERWAVRWTAAVAVVSQDERTAGERAGLAARWAEVGNGVDLERHAPAAAGRAALRTDLGVTAPLAVCVGRLSQQKGQDVLLAAWADVRARVPGAELVLVGDGPLREQLERALPPGVRLVGDVDDPRAWVRAADVVVLPSRWEGLSLALLEALAAGRSVVASDVAGMAEALSGGGGAVVPPDDPGALAAAVALRLGDLGLAAAEGERARRTAEQRFDLGGVRDRVAALYADLLAASA